MQCDNVLATEGVRVKREERQNQIMDLLVENGEVDLDRLADHFAVSKMTVHRDLGDLEQAGLLRKMRGGATIEFGNQFESDFRFRMRQGLEAKTRMARAALKFTEPGMTVIINDGSMAAILGVMISEKRPLTVITNNSAIVDALKAETGVTLIALGGTYSSKFNGFFGLVTEESLARLRADIAFISAPAVLGLDAFHMDERAMRAKRAMMASAEKSCLLINHQRFGKTALHHLAKVSEFATIITDAAPVSLASYVDAGIEIEIAGDKEILNV
jgi:DeoR/GlpR family transcriptional regulator of sugar metabolism